MNSKRNTEAMEKEKDICFGIAKQMEEEGKVARH